MKTLTVKVEGDHLRTLSHAKKPILAVAELIWNGLDADAQEVSVLLGWLRWSALDGLLPEGLLTLRN
jgi:hypothetical protein